MTLRAGEPLIVGALFGGACTWIENAGREALVLPSLTEMTMLDTVPTSRRAGVPESWPRAVSKVAHVGRLAIEKVSVSPSASLAVGLKRYAVPAWTLVAGEPL